jgi:hypothetical protein
MLLIIMGWATMGIAPKLTEETLQEKDVAFEKSSACSFAVCRRVVLSPFWVLF